MIEFKPEISELKTLVQNNQNKDLYAILINLDLTSLNKRFNYEKTTKLKNKLVEFLNIKFEKKLIYQKILGGKILIILNTKLISNDKQDIQNLSEKYLEDNQKYIYISEQEIKKNKLEITQLLYEQIQNELKLNKQRALIQRKLSSYNEIEKGQIENSKPIKILEIKKENLKILLQYVRQSTYLTNALYSFNQENYQVTLENTLCYKIWYEIQTLLFENYKVEKIKSIIKKTKIETSNPNQNVIGNEFKLQIEDLKDWYSSTIKNLYIHLTQAQLNEAKIIESKIFSLENIEHKNLEIHIITKKINEFIRDLNIKGVHAIPLDNQKPSREAIQFIQRQTHLLQNPKSSEEWNNMTNKSLSEPFRKQEYKTFVKGNSESILDSIKYTNNFTNSNILHFAFLEIDFFNAFNSYFFQNDTDKYYTQLLDKIFEIANSYIYKLPQIFKTLNIGLLGDEFFFTFLSINYLTQNEKDIIHEFLLKIEKDMLELTKNNLLIKSEKKAVIDKSGNTITMRVPMIKNSISKIDIITNSFKKEQMEIGKISISKYILQDIKLNIKNIPINDFEGIYEHISKQMDKIKENFEKKLIIETAHSL